MPEWRGQRESVGSDRGATPLARIRRTGESHHPLHQLAGRISDSRSRHLRHDDLYKVARVNSVRRTSRVDGLPAAVRRRAGQAILPAAQLYHDPSAVWRLFGPGVGYCNPCHGDPQGEEGAEQDLQEASDQGAYAGRD